MDKKNERLIEKIKKSLKIKETDGTEEQKIEESKRGKSREAAKEESVSVGMSHVSTTDISPTISKELSDIENKIKTADDLIRQTKEVIEQIENKLELFSPERFLEQGRKELEKKEVELKSIRSLHKDLEEKVRELYKSFERIESSANNLGKRIEQLNKSLEGYKKELEAKKEKLEIDKRLEEKNLKDLISQYRSQINERIEKVQEIKNARIRDAAYILAQKILLTIKKYGKEDFDELSLQDKEKVCIEIKNMYGYMKDLISSEEKILEEAAKVEGDEEKKKLYKRVAETLRKINNAYSCIFEEKKDKT